MNLKLNFVVSPAMVENPSLATPLEAMSLARLLDANLHEVFAVNKNRRVDHAWKTEQLVDAPKRRRQNG